MKIVREYPGIFVGPGEGPVFHYGCRPLSRQEGTTEEEGFEPPVRFPVQRFSRPPVSTAHPFLRF